MNTQQPLETTHELRVTSAQQWVSKFKSFV